MSGRVIWHFFTAFVNRDGVSKTRCHTCGKDLSLCRDSTSGMRYHLKALHPDEYVRYLARRKDAHKEIKEGIKKVQEADAAAAAEGLGPASRTKRQKFLDGDDNADGAEIDKGHRFEENDRRQLAFDLWVTQYLVEAGLPFSHVDTEAFRKLALRMYPRATVKSADIFTGEKLPHLSKAMKWDMDCLLEDEFVVKEPTGVAIVGRIWMDQGRGRVSFPFPSSPSFSSPSFFLSLDLHYLSQEWKPMQFTLACLPVPEGGCADTLSGKVDAIIKDIPALSNRAVVSKVVVIDGANMCMRDAVAKSELASGSFVCMDHRLQMVIERAFASEPLIGALLQKVAHLARQFHDNPLTGVSIKSEAERLRLAFVTIVKPVAARWSSHCLTIESIRILEVTLTSLRTKAIDIGVPHFSNEEMGALNTLGGILSEFEETSRALSAAPSCTVSSVISTLVNLQGSLLAISKSTSLSASADREVGGSCASACMLAGALGRFANNVRKELETEWPDSGSDERLIRLGHFYHPHFRGILLKKFNKYDLTIKEVVDGHQSTREFRQSRPDRMEDVEDEEDLDPAERLARDLGSDGIGRASSEMAPLELEIQTYLALPKPVQKAKVDVLAWWKHHQQSLPLLSELARGVLCVPVSLVGGSFSGEALNVSTYQMDPEAISALAFCQFNWQKVKCHWWSLDQELDDLARSANSSSSPSSPSPSASASHPPPSASASLPSVSQPPPSPSPSSSSESVCLSIAASQGLWEGSFSPSDSS